MKEIFLMLILLAVPLFAQTDYISVSVMRGDRTVLYWTVTTDYSSNFDVEFVVKATSDPSANRLIQKLNSDAGGDSAQVYVTSDTIQITINTANTLNWAARNYYYDILIEANGGGETDTTTIFQGVFTVLQDISSPTDGVVPGCIAIYTVALSPPDYDPTLLLGMNVDSTWYELTREAFLDTITPYLDTLDASKVIFTGDSVGIRGGLDVDGVVSLINNLADVYAVDIRNTAALGGKGVSIQVENIASNTEVFSLFSNAGADQLMKVFADGHIVMAGIPSDSTGLSTGKLWFNSTTGAIHRKF